MQRDEPFIVRQYLDILDAAGFYIFTANEAGEFVHVSDSIEQLTGYSSKEIIGKHFTFLIDPEWRKRVIKFYAQQLDGEREKTTYEFPIITLQGETRWVEQTVIWQSDNPDEVIQAVVRDISDLRQAQTKMSAQVEQLKTLHRIEEELADRLSVEYVTTMALDAAMRLANANAGYIGLIDDDSGLIHVTQVFGVFKQEITDANLQTGKGIVSRVLHNHKAELIPDVSQDPDYVENRAETHAQITIPLMTPNQDLIGVLNIESNRADVFDSETFELLKLLTGRISVAIENSRLYGQIESQLTQLRTLYERVSNLELLKTDMIRIASHDLRNPLSTIIGYVELMGWDLDKLEGVDHLNTHMKEIDDATKRMQKIILDILSLERIEETADNMNFFSLDFNALVEDVFQQTQPEATVKSRTMKLSLPEDTAMIGADEPQLREAITNLMTNAIKYTQEGGTIKVRVHFDMEHIVFEVEDNGIGIPLDQQERLFQPFFRAKTRETQRIEGTGLGLHLVKNIIERHKGKMHFNSEYGKGSTFGFYLPLMM